MHEESFFANPRTWVGVAFILFFLIFGRRIWGALVGMLDARTAEVRASLEEAARLRQEAEAMLRDAEARRAAAIEDARRLMEGAKVQAAQVAAQAQAEAEAASRRREQMAMDRIAAAEKAAVDEVRRLAADIAAAASRRVLSENLGAEGDAALIDRAIGQLPAALAAARRAA